MNNNDVSVLFPNSEELQAKKLKSNLKRMYNAICSNKEYLFTYDFCEPMFELYGPEIEKVVSLGNHGNMVSEFISKLMFYKRNNEGEIELDNNGNLTLDEEKFNNHFIQLFRENNIDENDEENLYKIKRIKNAILYRSAVTWSEDYKVKDSNEKKTLTFVITNFWTNPFKTVQTTFHEFCHMLQERYGKGKIGNKIERIYKIKELSNTYKQNKTRENLYNLNKSILDFYLDSFVQETQADFFGCLLPFIEALQTKNDKVIQKTIENIREIYVKYDKFNNFNIYFPQSVTEPLIIDYLEGRLDIQNFLSEGNIDYEKIFNYTYDKCEEKRKQYAEELTNEGILYDENYGSTMFGISYLDEVLKVDGEKFKKFVEEYKSKNLSLIQDYLIIENTYERLKDNEIYSLEDWIYSFINYHIKLIDRKKDCEIVIEEMERQLEKEQDLNEKKRINIDIETTREEIQQIDNEHKRYCERNGSAEDEFGRLLRWANYIIKNQINEKIQILKQEINEIEEKIPKTNEEQVENSENEEIKNMKSN